MVGTVHASLWTSGITHARSTHFRSLFLGAQLAPSPVGIAQAGRHVGSNRLDYGRVIDMGSFRRNYLQDALTNAELPPMRFHDLRHTAASPWLAAGFKPYEVSRWLGHPNVSTTDSIYAHLYPSDYSQHVARFDAFVARG